LAEVKLRILNSRDDECFCLIHLADADYMKIRPKFTHVYQKVQWIGDIVRVPHSVNPNSTKEQV
jgi:hypothetical protein